MPQGARITGDYSTCSRRSFLKAGSATLGLGIAGWSRAHAPATANAVIQLLLLGGPSQLDTWDPKPAAPSSHRGPFRPIRTTAPGLYLSELFPLTAQRAHQLAVVRSIHHDEAPTHQAGLQLLQTGVLSSKSIASHAGCATNSWVLIPGPIERTDAPGRHGQFGARAILEETSPAPERYGASQFGADCHRALQSVRRGIRFVTVNMFTSVHDLPTWDCHANGADLPASLNDYRDSVCPMFDRAYSALIDDLQAAGLLETTLVVAAGEFGRTPRLNPRGGRDHWPSVWSGLFAGGGVRGGQVVGASDRLGGEPHDCPIRAERVAATMLHALGIDPRLQMAADPIVELF
jgi:uncharacterized protein (DUF1501 family)